MNLDDRHILSAIQILFALELVLVSEFNLKGWRMKKTRPVEDEPHFLFLEEMTTPVVERFLESGDPLFIPVGTLEAHGRHLPVGTDTMCAKGIAAELAEKMGGAVAPAFSYGLTNLLAQTAPASFFPQDIFRAYLETAIKAYIAHGFRKIVIVNGHGGNRDALMHMCRALVRETPVALSVIHWWLLAEEASKEVYGAVGGHAAAEETAAMLYFHPTLVDPDLYDSANDDFTPNEGMWLYPPPGEVLVYDGNPLGRPNMNCEKAQRFMKSVISKIREILERWLSRITRLKGGLRPS